MCRHGWARDRYRCGCRCLTMPASERAAARPHVRPVYGCGICARHLQIRSRGGATANPERDVPAYPMTMNGRYCKNLRNDMPLALYTLGHGTLDADAFGVLVRENDFASVVDVRTVPKSGRHPQFRLEAMVDWIPRDTGASYRWEPALGGFGTPQKDTVNVD